VGAVSELQLALGALAALVLVGIWLHGRWQEHRVVRRLRERLQAGIGDPLLASGPRGVASPDALRFPPGRVPAAPADASGIGPGREATDARTGGPAAGEDSGPDPGREGGGGGASSETLRLASLHPPDWQEDPLLDCSLEIRCARAVDGVAVIDAVAPLAAPDWPMPVHFVVWDARHQQWVLPDRFGYYSDALASVQLGGRVGTLDAVALERFVQTVREVARALDADVDLPDEPRVLAQAQELDRLCARFDIRIALTVRPGPAPWTGPQVRSTVADLGWSVLAPQRWAMPSADGRPRFCLMADAPTPHALGLELDVALVADPAAELGEMVAQARQLAQALAGSVVDDNDRPIDGDSMRPVQEQLARVVTEMREAGIDPGGERAQRLYGVQR
jgi:hypothetical protein